MTDFESLTVISVEYYCEVNHASFKCLNMINSGKYSEDILIS